MIQSTSDPAASVTLERIADLLVDDALTELRCYAVHEDDGPGHVWADDDEAQEAKARHDELVDLAHWCRSHIAKIAAATAREQKLREALRDLPNKVAECPGLALYMSSREVEKRTRQELMEFAHAQGVMHATQVALEYARAVLAEQQPA